MQDVHEENANEVARATQGVEDLSERVFLRSEANNPTPLEDRTTASLLDELRDGYGDAWWLEQVAAEIMSRCAVYEGIPA